LTELLDSKEHQDLTELLDSKEQQDLTELLAQRASKVPQDLMGLLVSKELLEFYLHLILVVFGHILAMELKLYLQLLEDCL
jgi:hypothetical protein